MDECIFCMIIRGEIPCAKVYDDKDVIAFLDINPSSAGHVLVVPKKHSTNILETEEKDISACFKAIKKIAPALLQALGAQGFNTGINTHKAAGQAVMHTHIHLIPRFENDNLLTFPHTKYLEGQMEEIREKIVGSIGKK
jgi:histidine triad (HIT) family protein